MQELVGRTGGNRGLHWRRRRGPGSACRMGWGSSPARPTRRMYLDGFKKFIGTQHAKKFSIQSGNATPAPPIAIKNLPPPGSISILKMEEDSWGGCGGGNTGPGETKKKF